MQSYSDISILIVITFIVALTSCKNGDKNSEFNQSFNESSASTYAFLVNSKYHFPIKSSDDIIINSIEAVDGEVIFKYDMQGQYYNMPNDTICDGMKYYLSKVLCLNVDVYGVLRTPPVITSKHIIYRDGEKDSLCSIVFSEYPCE